MNMFEGKKEKVMMLRVSPEEALAIIRSLTNQLIDRSPNCGRLESYLDDGRDFSIAVDITNPRY